MNLTVTFSTNETEGKEFITLTIQQQNLKSYKISTLLSDVGENMLNTRRGMILDFSRVEFLDSLCFGAIANIAGKAKETKTSLKLRLSPSLTKFVELLSFDKIVEIID